MKTLLLLLTINLSFISCVHTLRGRPLYKHEIPRTTADFHSNLILPKEQWFDQRLNHFDPTDTRTFKQRYFLNDTFFKSGGPIFLLLGGEGEINPIWLIEGQIATNYAKHYNAMIVDLEHRYYGKSRPTPDLSVENLRYLTSEQALQDVAYFIEYLNSKLSSENSKWIVFGGSYAGNLATWFRAKYPHLVVGAVASSAPLNVVINFKEYLGVVTRSLGQECVNSFREATAQLSEELQRPLSWTALEEQFKLCDPLNGSQENDISNLVYTMTEKIKNVVQFNGDNRQFDAVNGHTRHVEFGYYQTSDLKSQPFGSYLPLDFFVKQCTDIFGPEFDFNLLQKGIDFTRNFYGGIGLKVSKVVFINGSNDPWHVLGVLKDLNSDAKAFLINGTAHCADMFPDSDHDNQQLKEARKFIFKALGEFLND